MTDREIVTGYLANVWTISCLLHTIDWNQRHGLPLLNLPERVQELKRELNRFEDVLVRIPDRKIRIILRCRYALGWSVIDTAIYTDMSCNTVSRYTDTALQRLS